jgi:uncharacterized Rossmann fold enzyme
VAHLDPLLKEVKRLTKVLYSCRRRFLTRLVVLSFFTDGDVRSSVLASTHDAPTTFSRVFADFARETTIEEDHGFKSVKRILVNFD